MEWLLVLQEEPRVPQPPQPLEAVDRAVVRPQRHHLRVYTPRLVGRALLAAEERVGKRLLARGVDFGRVSLVVQMQTPRDVATYLHRVGRTGRFGTVGLSVLLVADHEAAPALALLRGAGVEPRPLPRALDERDYLQRIESG